jgi:hypothetical protein
MTKSTWRDRRSFGPTIIHGDGDELRAICTWCCFRVGDSCTHKSPPRRIPNPEATPEWCELLADMMAEAKAKP